jgi:hypothetical protein
MSKPMDENLEKILEQMRANTWAAEERARERIREWFEQYDRPFVRTKQSRRNETWMLVVAVLCSGLLFRSHTAAMQALSIIHSHLGV